MSVYGSVLVKAQRPSNVVGKDVDEVNVDYCL